MLNNPPIFEQSGEQAGIPRKKPGYLRASELYTQTESAGRGGVGQFYAGIHLKVHKMQLWWIVEPSGTA
ncbi:hypothetical protein, partial [Corynebacterium afermentans]|uniref:hypothetical protein n=1 Tax=Corynebacterium afermentans TaxID=38286 RepID=UPI002572EB6C